MWFHDCALLTIVCDALLIGVAKVGLANLIAILSELDLLTNGAGENVAGFRLGLLCEEHLGHLTGRPHRPVITKASMLQRVPAFPDDAIGVHEIDI